MGVPGLFAWLRKRYPEISSPLIKKKDGAYTGIRGKVDNLYIDTNHIIHACAHGSVAKGRDRLTEQQVFARMEAYLEALLEATQPQKLVFCAVDGVAPQAKQAQQRTRRFLSAYVAEVTDETEKEVRREMLSETGGSVEVPHIPRFDSNQITPGTAFMAAVADFLAKWFRAKVARDPRFANLVVMVSDASEPAEGEHKIMRFIRAARSDPTYDPHTRHCIYGQDADLLLLGLLSHEPDFVVLREDMAAKSQPPLKPSFQGDTKPLGEGKQTKLDLANTTARAVPGGTSVITDTASTAESGAPGGLGGVAGSSTNPTAGVAKSAAAASGAGSGSKPELHGNNLQGVVPCFEQVNIGVLRDCIHWEFEEFLGSPDGCSIDELLLGGEATFRFGTPTISHAHAAASTPSRKQQQQQQQQQQPDTSAAADAAAGLPHREWYPPEAYFFDSKGRKMKCWKAVEGQQTQQHSPTRVARCTEEGAGSRSAGAHPSQQQQQQQQQHEGQAETSSAGAVRIPAASPELPAAASPTFAAMSSPRLSLSPLPHPIRTTPSLSLSSPPPTPGTPEAVETSFHAPAPAQDDANADADAGANDGPGAHAQPEAEPQPADPDTAGGALTAHVAPLEALSGPPTPGPPTPPPISATANSAASAAGAGVLAQAAGRVEQGDGGDAEGSVGVAAGDMEVLEAAEVGEGEDGWVEALAEEEACSVVAAEQGEVQEPVKHAPKKPVAVNLERILDDLVLLTFLAGNDFLPFVPSLDLYDYPSSLDLIFTAYKTCLPDLGSGITQSGGELNFHRLQMVLKRLVGDEKAAYQRRANTRRKAFEKEQNKAADATAQVMEQLGGLSLGGASWVSMGELPFGTDLEELLSTLTAEQCAALGHPRDEKIDLCNATQEEVRAEFARRVGERVSAKVMNPDVWAEDPVGLTNPGYRERYYNLRFKANGNIDKVAKQVARDFIDGMAWVYRYYSFGPATVLFHEDTHSDTAEVQGSAASQAGMHEGASWTWTYPHHYAPLICDLCNSSIASYKPSGARRTSLFSPPIRLARDLGDPAAAPLHEWAPKNGPIRPLMQLMSVLPPRSASEALPGPLATLLVLAQLANESNTEDECCSDDAAPRAKSRSGTKAGTARAQKRREPQSSASTSRYAALLDAPTGEESEQEDTSNEGDEPRRAEEDDWVFWVDPDQMAALNFYEKEDLLASLAHKLAPYFPSDIQSLIDFAGKKWMHTGVVALSHMDPKLLATVLHTAFASGVELDERSRAGNVFHPATMFASRRTVNAAKQSLAEQRGVSLPASNAAPSQDVAPATATPATAAAASPSALSAGTSAHAAAGAAPHPATPTELAAELPLTNAAQSQGSSNGNETSINMLGPEGLGSSQRRGTATRSQAPTKQPALPLRAPWVPSQVANEQAQDNADTAWTLLLHAYKGPDSRNQAAPQIATRLVGLQNSVLGMLAARHDATVVVALPVDIAGLPVPPADAVCRMLQPIGSGDGLKISAAQYCKAAARRANAQNFVDKLLGLTSFGTPRGAGGGGRGGGGGAGGGGRFSRDSRLSMTPVGWGSGGQAPSSSSYYNNSMHNTGRGSGSSINSNSMNSIGRGFGGRSAARLHNGIGSQGSSNPGAARPSASADSSRGGSSRPHTSGFLAASSQPPSAIGITTSFGQTGISPYGPKAGITTTFGQTGINPYGPTPSTPSNPFGSVGPRPSPPPPPSSYGGGAFPAPPPPPPVSHSRSLASAPGTSAPSAVTYGRPGRVPCKFFQEGRCAKGSACTFSHEASTSAATEGVSVAGLGRGARGRGFGGNSRGGF